MIDEDDLSTENSDEPATALEPGTVLAGRYKLIEQIGRGGMGVVWAADDTTAERKVVLKFVPSEVKNYEFAVAKLKESFRNIHELQHQHICPLYTLEEDPVLGYYLVMKLLVGETLEQHVRRTVGAKQPLPLDKVLQILRPIAEALDYAHRKRIIHRDIKPSNIFIVLDEAKTIEDIQVIDFGLASEVRSTLTRISQVRFEVSGTRPYMAPEQWRGRSQTAQTDQYALAVVAYRLLCGYLPFDGSDTQVLGNAVLNVAPEPIPAMPEYINAALLKGLAKNAEDRFGNCTSFVASLTGNEHPAIENPLDTETAPTPPPLQDGIPHLSIFEAVKVGDLSAVRWWLKEDRALLQTKNTSTENLPFLHFAVKHCPNFEVVKYLINLGVNVDEKDDDGNTLLHWAAKNNDKEMVEFFVRAGANINEKNASGQTLLHNAVRAKSRRAIEFLSHLGADANAQNNDGDTPLLLTHDREIAETLVKAGANLHFKDEAGNSLIHLAVQKGGKRRVSLFVELGANVKERDGRGNTTLHWAAMNGDKKMTALLIKLGADPGERNDADDSALRLWKSEELPSADFNQDSEKSDQTLQPDIDIDQDSESEEEAGVTGKNVYSFFAYNAKGWVLGGLLGLVVALIVTLIATFVAAFIVEEFDYMFVMVVGVSGLIFSVVSGTLIGLLIDFDNRLHKHERDIQAAEHNPEMMPFSIKTESEPGAPGEETGTCWCFFDRKCTNGCHCVGCRRCLRHAYGTSSWRSGGRDERGFQRSGA